MAFSSVIAFIITVTVVVIVIYPSHGDGYTVATVIIATKEVHNMTILYYKHHILSNRLYYFVIKASFIIESNIKSPASAL